MSEGKDFEEKERESRDSLEDLQFYLDEITFDELSVRTQRYKKYDTSKLFEYLEMLYKEGAKIPILTQKTAREILGSPNAYTNTLLHRLCVEEKLVRLSVKNYNGYVYTCLKYLPEKIRKQTLIYSLTSVLDWYKLKPEERLKLIQRVEELKGERK